jgi:hypothetical protein
MRTVSLALTAALLAAPVLAQQPAPSVDQQALAHARADYDAARRNHDKAGMKRAEAELRAAYGEAAMDRQAAEEADKPPPHGVPRPVYEALIRAGDAHREALLSGNPQRIAQTEQALRAAYAKEWGYEHPNHPGGPH